MSRAWREEGAALVLSLFLMMAMSVLAASMMFLSQTETYATMNYRLTSQARYGAESGVHKAANYLLNSYTAPGGASDPITAYDLTRSPVTYNGQPVVLSTTSGVASNYPVAPTVTAFQNAASGSLASGNTTVQYTASATLMSMRMVDVYGSSTPVAIQTWQITAQGIINAGRTATVEVSSVLEQQITPANSYAAFATYNGCEALKWDGGAVSDSYDSKNVTKAADGNVITQARGGNVGTNGNLKESGSKTTINGALYTPRTGVGECKNGNVTAWTQKSSATVTGGLIELPQAITLAAPAPPNPTPPTTDIKIDKNDTCASLGISGCSGTKPNLILAPGTYGDLRLEDHVILHLQPGIYGINSIKLAGDATLVVDPPAVSGASPIVVLNVAGQGKADAVDFTGGSQTNEGLDSSILQVLYAGTGKIKLKGHATASAVIYAPNADVSFSGGTDFFGSIVGKTVDNTGGTHLHYDRQLTSEFMTVGNPMLTSFTWKKY